MKNIMLALIISLFAFTAPAYADSNSEMINDIIAYNRYVHGRLHKCVIRPTKQCINKKDDYMRKMVKKLDNLIEAGIETEVLDQEDPNFSLYFNRTIQLAKQIKYIKQDF